MPIIRHVKSTERQLHYADPAGGKPSGRAMSVILIYIIIKNTIYEVSEHVLTDIVLILDDYL
jgi:hypothetical protein